MKQDHDSFIFFHDWARNYFYDDMTYEQIGRLIFAICDSRISGKEPTEEILNDQLLRFLYRTIRTSLDINDLKYAEQKANKAVAAHMKAFKANNQGLTEQQYEAEKQRFRMQIDAEQCRNVQNPAKSAVSVNDTVSDSDTDTESVSESVSGRGAGGYLFTLPDVTEPTHSDVPDFFAKWR